MKHRKPKNPVQLPLRFPSLTRRKFVVARSAIGNAVVTNDATIHYPTYDEVPEAFPVRGPRSVS